MQRDGWPTLFWAQHEIYGRFDSWPVCTRRVRCQQTYYKYAKTKTWGSVTLDARTFGEYFIRSFPDAEDTHIKDRRLMEWFIDSDQCNEQVTILPVNWEHIIHRADEFIRRKHIPVFCMKCNHCHPYRDLHIQDDELGPGSCYNRLVCPEGHILFKYERIHLCHVPKNGIDYWKRAGHNFRHEYGYPSSDSWWVEEDFGDIRFESYIKASMGLFPDSVCSILTEEEKDHKKKRFPKETSPQIKYF